MKVIETSNYNLDNFPEKQVSFDNLSRKEAQDIAAEMNRELNGTSPVWHTVVEDDYILDDGDPNS